MKNVGRMRDEVRYRTAWMIYIPEDRHTCNEKVRERAGRGAGDLGPEAEDDKCDIQDRLRRQRRRRRRPCRDDVFSARRATRSDVMRCEMTKTRGGGDRRLTDERGLSPSPQLCENYF